MAKNSSAREREGTPHATNTTKQTISSSLRRRAEAVIRHGSVDAQSRALLRYGVEINDPWLGELVSSAEAGESISEKVRVLANADNAVVA